MSSLTYTDFEGHHDIVADTVKSIRQADMGPSRLCLRFSGGKDSIVSKKLFDLAGVQHDSVFSKTSVDPPELLAFIRRYYPMVHTEKNRTTMFRMIVEKGFPPSRMCRYCCAEFKERNCCPEGDVLTCTGVRKAESPKRKLRKQYEFCQAHKGIMFFHPIVDWSDENVWDFIHEYRLPYPSLYDEGFKRIGCVGCPMASAKQIEREFARWPSFEKAYMWAFEKMLEGRQYDKWKTAADVREWYVYGVHERYKQLEGQLEMFEGDYYEQFDANDESLYFIEDTERRLSLERFKKTNPGYDAGAAQKAG